MTTTKLGHGLYDAAEVARLMGHPVDWVVRWSTASANGPAIVEPTFERWFSFADLVSFRVALTVRQKGIADRDLRRGIQTLQGRTGLARPLAVTTVIESLATSGNSFLSDLSGEFEDIGKGGQGVFQNVVRLNLTRISFDDHGNAERWEPAKGVVIDPAIQAGAPCVAGTRIPTATIGEMLAESDAEDLALDFDISVEAIELAAAFEELLDRKVGLAA